MANYTYFCNEMTPMHYYSRRTCENLNRRRQKIAAPKSPPNWGAKVGTHKCGAIHFSLAQ
jgi:hypothetical protein